MSNKVVHEKEAPQIPVVSSIKSPPQKKYVRALNSNHLQTANSNECRICRESRVKRFWIGCSDKNKLIGC